MNSRHERTVGVLSRLSLRFRQKKDQKTLRDLAQEFLPRRDANLDPKRSMKTALSHVTAFVTTDREPHPRLLAPLFIVITRLQHDGSRSSRREQVEKLSAADHHASYCMGRITLGSIKGMLSPEALRIVYTWSIHVAAPSASYVTD